MSVAQNSIPDPCSPITFSPVAPIQFIVKNLFYASLVVDHLTHRIGPVGSWICRRLRLGEQTYTDAYPHNNTDGHNLPNANVDANRHSDSYRDRHTDTQCYGNANAHPHGHTYAEHHADAIDHAHTKQYAHGHTNPGR